ncbi:MAG: ATP-dependent helicase, partial [Verrucomicrobiales bacterium]
MSRTYTLQPDAAGLPEVEIDFSQALNPQQFEAVTSPPGQALVIAGAGSGKTRTLTYRVAYLIANAISPENILLLTFTNKAAREMLERVNDLVPGQAASVWGGTFHSIGNRLLRRHADVLGFTRSFSILDSDDQKSLLTKIINSSGFAVDGEAPRGKKGRRKSDSGFPKAPVLGGIISLATNTCRAVDEIIRDRYAYFEESSAHIQQVAASYARKKKESNSMDFDDLLALTVKLLRQHEAVRRYYQRQFQFILVDEYQDTNALQSEFIDVLAGEDGNIMVVGDDAQSIYSWRGANFENILKFPQRHPSAQVYRIETNYRSVPEVLELANESILANKRQFRKVLRADRTSRGARPALVALADPQVQAAFVSQRLRELHERDGIPWRDMAVLYRAHFQSMDVQMQLTQDRIPFLITSGLRFFEQAHVKDVVSFLKWAANPRDEVSFDRMVRLLPGIGAGAAGKLWLEWVESGGGGIGGGGIGGSPMGSTGGPPMGESMDTEK